jgi:hypothetical protein
MTGGKMQDFINEVKCWIYWAKRWIVHKLGGYMANECIVDPSKVLYLKCTRRYSKDAVYSFREMYTVGHMRADAVKKFAEGLIPYIVSEVSEDDVNREYVIRTTIRVVDDRR